ncbi:sugar-binding domain-containing protein [Mucilaginibacter sp. X5P1]|uniref:sugar-binding domain-containing protein n=1 Tax=Mucilaginibacter sp. X5P1 TaxID=2723088 RepID=UPI00160C879A|nr:sugar-binding domain-containing protein [Mucilaginibacter sp. X5P1]MBB6139506.1 hypothetical protein [Mucilaginibacter sp. X5P1]
MKRILVVLFYMVCILSVFQTHAQQISLKPGVNQSNTQETIPLQGQWNFALDINDEGIHKKWFLGSMTDEIALPGTTDIAGWGTPDQSPWINYLQRKHKYIGAAWYQKTIDIPATWSGYNTELFLERVKWESRVWVDGKELSKADDGLVVSHTHNLGKLSPGKHLVSIRIDNRMIHPIGDKGHNYTEQTESIWNGIVGKIELRRRNIISLNRMRLFPDNKGKAVSVELNIDNPAKLTNEVNLNVSIKDDAQKTIGTLSIKKQLDPETLASYKISIPVTQLKRWSEFQQPLYTATCTVTAGQQTETSDPVTFGFRDLKTTRYKIVVNNVPAFIRGNQETLDYPLTGYPPMDVETWKKIFKIYKSYGLNQVRFHSACPPDAAFQAADEVGIYMMVELVWMTSRNAIADIRPISATMGLPKGIGNHDRTIDSFVMKETRRLLDQYGNHPSFCFFAFGNEMDNLNKQVVNQWLGDLKKDDPRHLYAGTTARMVLPNDDFQESHMVPGKGLVVNETGNPSTITNYDSAYIYTKVPVIAHELGQVPVYPSWKEIAKYDKTPFRFINLEKSLALAKQNHIDMQAEDFRKASGYLQQLLYKDDIEREFRSRYSAGFNLLEMNDYTGQGEALIGWLDAFYDSKGITTPAQFRNFCNNVVPLAKFPKRVYKTTEELKVSFQLACNTQTVLKTGLKWELVAKNDKHVILSGKFNTRNLSPGTLADFGTVNIKFPAIDSAAVYTLALSTTDGKYANSWNFWVFPDDVIAPFNKSNVKICNNITDAMTMARQGNKVLFMASDAGDPLQKDYSAFLPVFWSTIFFPGEGSQTLSALIRNDHPTLKGFPTANMLDWQWQDLCDHSRGTVLDGEALNIDPIVQPIDDFHANKKLASLFEIKFGKGSILVCDYNIVDDLDNRPAAKQLRYSLLNYIGSDNFKPVKELSEKWLQDKFYKAKTDSTKINSKDEDKSAFHLLAGTKSAPGEGMWHKDADELLANKFNVTWNLLQGDVVNDNKNHQTGWTNNKKDALKFELHTAITSIGFVSLKIMANKATTETIVIDGRKSTFAVSNEPQWIKLQYFREDFDDGKLTIEILPEHATAMVTVAEIKMITDN